MFAGELTVYLLLRYVTMKLLQITGKLQKAAVYFENLAGAAQVSLGSMSHKN